VISYKRARMWPMSLRALARHLTFVMNSGLTNAMKYRFWLLVPLTVALADLSAAQEIHKCIGDGAAVTYQNAPCEPAKTDAGPLRLPGYADPAERDGATAPAADAAAAAPTDTPFPAAPPPAMSDAQPVFPFRTSVALGMTDDQVLNVPGWGRPTKIVRAGSHGNWRETWTYDRGNDMRQLAFVGGRLVGIDAGPIQVASIMR
jgi:hypothetical protein